MESVPVIHRQCYKCGKVPSKIKGRKGAYYVYCKECDRKGNECETKAKAVRDWNKRHW